MLSIKQMPIDARVWVFQSNRILSDPEINAIEKEGQLFIAGWKGHGLSLKASFDILYNHFIVISVDEKQAAAGGCSIDEANRFIKKIEQQFNLVLLDRMQVAYHQGNEIKTCHLNNLFEELTLSGLYSKEDDKDKMGEIIVFNNMVITKKQFDTEWEVPLKQSWQSRILV